MSRGSLRRFSDDLDLREGVPPQTYGGLLNALKVSGKPEYIKKRRIKRWLRHNEPSHNLCYFLNSAGYDVEVPRGGPQSSPQ